MNGAEHITPLSSNDAILLNCGYYIADFFDASPNEITEVLAIHLHPGTLREIFRNDLPNFVKAESKSFIPSKIVNNAVLEKFVESLTFYFDNPEVVNDDILALKVRELILLLVQSAHAESIHELITSLFSRKAVAISDVLRVHLYSDFTVSELAKLAGLSLTSFKEAFVTTYGEPPARYIRKKKIERAKEMLLTSDYNISEIADKAGYKDVSHFSKSFQSMTGLSPTSFRLDFRRR